MSLVIAKKADDDLIYADLTVERDKAIHFGFPDTQTAEQWANKVIKKMVNNQRRIVNAAGIGREWTMPEKCHTEEA